MNCISTKFVLYLFIDEQKENSINISEELLDYANVDKNL